MVSIASTTKTLPVCSGDVKENGKIQKPFKLYEAFLTTFLVIVYSSKLFSLMHEVRDIDTVKLMNKDNLASQDQRYKGD